MPHIYAVAYHWTYCKTICLLSVIKDDWLSNGRYRETILWGLHTFASLSIKVLFLFYMYECCFCMFACALHARGQRLISWSGVTDAVSRHMVLEARTRPSAGAATSLSCLAVFPALLWNQNIYCAFGNCLLLLWVLGIELWSSLLGANILTH